MLNKVIVTQSQIIEDTSDYSFDGEVISFKDDAIKILYLNDVGKKGNIIIKKISNDELEMGSLGLTNRLKIHELTEYRQTISGYNILLLCRLNSFVFTQDYIEINYSFYQEEQKISDNLLKIVNKN